MNENFKNLLKRKKYTNIHYLNKFKYSFVRDYSVLLKDIDKDNLSLSVFYTLLNSERLNILFNYYSWNYVYENKRNSISLSKDIIKKIKSIEKELNPFLKKYSHSLINLDFPIKKTSLRLNKKLISIESGYHTYGDFEAILSGYISLIFNFSELNEIIKSSIQHIENIELRKGLTSFLSENMRQYYIF
jgi:hypothetical protein